jgi:PAS domain S-box-containing protein
MTNVNNSYEEVLKQTTSSKSLIFQFSKTYPAYIVFIVLFIFSFFVKSFFADRVKTDNRNEYDKAVSSIMSRFEKVNESNSQVLKSMRSLYDNMPFVSRDYFFLYGSVPVKTYSSILSLMSVSYVPANKLGEFEYNTKSQGHLEYQVFPKEKKPFYFPVEFIVLDDNNGHKRGFDLSSQPFVLSAIEKARDNNSVIATPTFEIRKPDTLGLYLLSPVYVRGSKRDTESERKNNFTGLVVLETNMKKFFEQSLGEGLPSDKTVIFQVSDIDENGKVRNIFSSMNADLLKNKYSPLEKSDHSLKFADRDIIITFQTVPEFGNQFQSFLPTLAFIISLATSFLFFGFILSVTTSRARAVDLADRMTRSQRRIVEASKDIIGVMSLTGDWKSINPASFGIFGFNPNEMLGKNISELFLDNREYNHIVDLFSKAAEDQNERLDTKVKTKFNDIKYINWNFTISQKDQLVYLIGRDVTLEKLAEEEAKLKSKQVQLAEQFTREASEFKSFFIRKLSHYLRNSLTGVIGYLQLLNTKIYETEEEHDSYVEMAEDSAEELFSFVADMDDVAQYSDHQLAGDISSVKVYKFINEGKEKLKTLGLFDKIDIDLTEESRNAIVVADQTFISDIFVDLYKALSIGSDKTEIQIVAQENPYEGATEIQILSTGNDLVAEKINLFKQYKNNLIDSLKFDSDDILLNFAIAYSNLRMINGIMTLETLGKEDGNLVQIILPSNKKTN